MKRFHFTPDIKIILCIFLLLSIGSCREEEGSDKNEAADYGTIPLSIIWQTSPTREKRGAGSPPAIEKSDAASAKEIDASTVKCPDLKDIIEDVRIIISGTGMPEMVDSFDYTKCKGTITGVPVGTGRDITCEGLDSHDYARYTGRTNINVVKGENPPVYIEVDRQPIEVSPSGLYKTIQSAIDAAGDGDTIVVDDGVYEENIFFSDKSITVRSINGPDHVSIGNTDNRKSVVTFRNDVGTLLEGVTIWRGFAIGGAGIYIYSSSPKIRNCIITENRTRRGNGGGVACDNSSSAELTNCIIKSNGVVNLWGGGIYCGGQSTLTIRNCNINNNPAFAAGGIGIEDESDIKIINCKISGNTTDRFEGAAISCKKSTATLINSIIASNRGVGGSYTGGIYIWNSPSPVEIINCCIINNQPGGIYVESTVKPKIVNSIIWGNSVYPDISFVAYSDIEDPRISSCNPPNSDGNINCDPKFINNIDYCLHENSSCINRGTNDKTTYPNLPDKDFYGRDRVDPYDMGAYEYQEKNSEIYVRLEGDSTVYNSIQDAINEAPPCQCEVIVESGKYYENIDFLGKSITVRSEDGPEETIIDGNSRGSVVTFASGESDSSIFSGFKIINGSSFYGGGIYVNDNSSPKISDCIICSNGAGDGGGVGIYNNSSPTITNCTVRNNSAFYGGGIYVNDASSLTITSSSISSNIVDNGGGGIMGSGIFDVKYVYFEITNCTISNNKSDYTAGGIGVDVGNARITNCLISNNIANSNGGGIYFYFVSAKITNCIIYSNEAGNGGGIASLESNNVQITNCTIHTNSPNGISYTPLWGRYHSTVTNSIIWGNIDSQIMPSDGPVIQYSDIQNGWSGSGDGNIGDDLDLHNPMFAGGGDYHLQTGSPCIDAGTGDTSSYPSLPNDDIEGTLRPLDGDGSGTAEYDMGAYEYDPPP